MENYSRSRGPVSGLVNGIRINLIDDLEAFCTNALEEQGINRDCIDDPIIDFCRLQKRLIVKRPRKICKSREFKCPPGYEDSLRNLELCIKFGNDLSPFMTRNIRKLKKEDLMLYDWGLYHFHLSKEQDKDGYMKRSDYLLIAYVSNDAVYLIKVVSHREVSSHLWANSEYLEILSENWPELIKRNQIDNIVLSAEINESEYYHLRKAHVMTCAQLVNGKIYCAIGGGYTSNGWSLDALLNAQSIRKKCYCLEKKISYWFWIQLNENAELIRRQVKDRVPLLKLIGTNGKRFFLIEPNMRLFFKVDFCKDRLSISMTSFEDSCKILI